MWHKVCQQNSWRQRADHCAVADLGFCFVCSAKCKWEETTQRVTTYATETGEGAGIGGTKDGEKQEGVYREDSLLKVGANSNQTPESLRNLLSLATPLP